MTEPEGSTKTASPSPNFFLGQFSLDVSLYIILLDQSLHFRVGSRHRAPFLRHPCGEMLPVLPAPPFSGSSPWNWKVNSQQFNLRSSYFCEHHKGAKIYDNLWMFPPLEKKYAFLWSCGSSLLHMAIYSALTR